MTYTHLTRDERYRISAALEHNETFRQMAARLGRSASSLSREVARNGGRQHYCADIAQARADARMAGNQRARTLSDEVLAHVRCYLAQGMSPEQTSGRMKLEGAGSVSHESIYQRIYAAKRAGLPWNTLLRCQKPRRKRYGSGQERRGVLRNRVDIAQRAPVVELRERVGDTEGDTVIGKNGQGVLVTLVDRKSRYCWARLLASKHAVPVAEAVVQMLGEHKDRLHTITFDNGKEFAEHEYMAKRLGVQVYFAKPYCSWQRGTNENTNGLLRQYFAKSTNLLLCTQSQVDDAVYALNHRPRKCLGYRTPHEVFHGYEVTPLKLPSDALRA